MIRLAPRSLPTTTFGVHGPFTVVLFCFLLVIGSGLGWAAVFLGSWEVLQQIFTNLWLTIALSGVYLVWAVGVVRTWVTAATGAGFPLAAGGLSSRVLADNTEALVPPWIRAALPDERTFALLDFARDFGFVSCVTGLAFVVFAVVGELVLRRRAPDWALPP